MSMQTAWQSNDKRCRRRTRMKMPSTSDRAIIGVCPTPQTNIMTMYYNDSVALHVGAILYNKTAF
eukprot:6491935-Amphidinium_carterae.1